MEVCAFASGSSGNCFYVENNGNAILIDAGINAREIVDSLFKIQKNPRNIRGIFVTHEHSDHVKGVDVFARKFSIPVFATRKTAENCSLCSNETLVNLIKNNEVIEIAGMSIEAFSKSHKCADPVSYSVSHGKRVSIITDLGYSCKNVAQRVYDSDFLFIESNYDEAMLENGPYPSFLKKWIKSNVGHLSNTQSGLCVLEHASSKLRHVVLSHLSQNNNTPLLALQTFSSIIKERRDLSPKMSISPREKSTPLFII